MRLKFDKKFKRLKFEKKVHIVRKHHNYHLATLIPMKSGVFTLHKLFFEKSMFNLICILRFCVSYLKQELPS